MVTFDGNKIVFSDGVIVRSNFNRDGFEISATLGNHQYRRKLPYESLARSEDVSVTDLIGMTVRALKWSINNE